MTAITPPPPRQAAKQGHAIDAILRQAIRRGVLPPGAPLVQESLAEQLGVSRIPVRESLRALEAEGLVVFTGQGAVVTELSATEIQELYSLRILLEMAVVDAIVSNIRPPQLRRLKSLVEAMDEFTEKEDRLRWAESNFEFHDNLGKTSGMEHHQRLSRQVLMLTETYSRWFVFGLGGQAESQAEHHVMIAALETGDAQSLRDALQKHSTRGREGLLAFLSDREAEVPLDAPVDEILERLAAGTRAKKQPPRGVGGRK